MVAELVREAGARQECTVFGQSWRTAPGGAALANGTMIGGYETDHSFTDGSTNPAPPSSRRDGPGGAESCRRRIVPCGDDPGYEVICRVGHAATGPSKTSADSTDQEPTDPSGRRRRQESSSASTGPGLPMPGIAGSTVPAPWNSPGGFHGQTPAPRPAAQTGLESALLAAKALPGRHHLEGKYGFLNLFSPTPHPERAA